MNINITYSVPQLFSFIRITKHRVVVEISIIFLCHNVVQPSVIVRAVVNKLARGSRISRDDRQALKEFSLDIINCLAIMHGLHYCADINANELLRRIVLGLPDQLIDK